MKTCNECNVEKIDSAFEERRLKCRDCRKKYSKKFYSANKERLKKLTAEWNKKHPEKQSKYKKKWKLENREYLFNRRLIRQFGITAEQYWQMHESQKGVCKICGLNSKKRLCVDHCHDTGNIRGLLCMNCNTAMGLFKESKVNVANALKYLDEAAYLLNLSHSSNGATP